MKNISLSTIPPLLVYFQELNNFFLVSEPILGSSNMSSSTLASGSFTSNTSTMAHSTTSSSMNLMNQPLLLLSNMANMMTVKLDCTNYIVWKHQITMVLETYSMFDLLDEMQSIPKKFLKDLSRSVTAIVNPDYLTWKSKEKALLTFISSTISPSILAITVACTIAIDVWKMLENHYSYILLGI